MATIQELASTAFDAFESKKRDNGESLWKFKDGSPEWLTDMARAGHGDMFPDDFRYAFIRDAVCVISDADSDADPDDIRDSVFEWAENDCDVYNSRLATWLASHAARVGFVDESVEVLGFPREGIMAAIRAGQIGEREEVYFAILDFLEAMADDES